LVQRLERGIEYNSFDVVDATFKTTRESDASVDEKSQGEPLVIAKLAQGESNGGGEFLRQRTIQDEPLWRWGEIN